MKSLAISTVFLMLLSPALKAQTNSFLIEDMTWTEVRDAIAAGKTTAIYYAGSTEQSGPGFALGKHVIVARYLAPKICRATWQRTGLPHHAVCPDGRLGLHR